MNTIAFTPQVRSEIVTTNRKNTPNFTGLNKAPKAGQVKEACSMFKGFYEMFFVPGKETITGMKDGNVFTQETFHNGAKRISKKYKMWSKKPVEIVEDNAVTQMRKRTKINNNGTVDLEFRDMHQPEYNVSVKYEQVTPTTCRFKDDTVSGDLTIKYCDKEVTLTPEKREELKKEFSDLVTKKYSDRIDHLLDGPEDKGEFLNEYYHDTDVIGLHLLKAPSALQKQLNRISGSLPYGIEAVLEKMGKM